MPKLRLPRQRVDTVKPGSACARQERCRPTCSAAAQSGAQAAAGTRHWPASAARSEPPLPVGVSIQRAPPCCSARPCPGQAGLHRMPLAAGSCQRIRETPGSAPPSTCSRAGRQATRNSAASPAAPPVAGRCRRHAATSSRTCARCAPPPPSSGLCTVFADSSATWRQQGKAPAPSDA